MKKTIRGISEGMRESVDNHTLAVKAMSDEEVDSAWRVASEDLKRRMNNPEDIVISIFYGVDKYLREKSKLSGDARQLIAYRVAESMVFFQEFSI